MEDGSHLSREAPAVLYCPSQYSAAVTASGLFIMPDRPTRKRRFPSSSRAASPTFIAPAVANPDIQLAALRLLDDLIIIGDPANEMATYLRAAREPIEVVRMAVLFLTEMMANIN